MAGISGKVIKTVDAVFLDQLISNLSGNIHNTGL